MRQIKKLGLNTASLTFASALTLGSTAFIAPTPVAQAQNKCTDIHVVTTLGTGGSWSDKSTEPKEGVAPDYNITAELIAQHGADKVSGWNTNYPASVGAISMFWGLLKMPGGKEQVSFGKSIQDGVNKADAHISQYKAACPNSKFVIIGYSQGASVAGDIARDISAGKVPGVGPDDVTNVLLIADPGRASNSAYESYTGKPSTLYGPIPPGVMGKNFEIIAPSSGARADRIGWTGERPGRFDGMYGKVLSLCDENDLACSAPPNSFLRSIADYAMVETQIANFDADLGNRITEAVNHFTNSGGVQAAQAGDIPRVQKLLEESAVKANLTIADIPAGLALVKELSDLVGKIKNECGGVDLGDVIKSVFVYLIPTLIENNFNVDGLKRVWGQIPPEFRGMADAGVQSLVAGARGIPVIGDMVAGVDSVDGLLKVMSENPARKMLVNWILKGLHGLIAKPIYAWVGNSLGMDPNKNDLSTFGQQVAYFAGFTVAHGSYWNVNRIGDKSSADYARDWIKESVNNALAGKSYVAPAKGKNLTDASLETTLESQTGADGKVICNPEELDTGLGPEGGSGETKPAPGGVDGDGGSSAPSSAPAKPSTGGKTTAPAKPGTTTGGKTTAPAKPSTTNGGKTTAPTKPDATTGGKTTAPAKPGTTTGGKTTAPAKPGTATGANDGAKVTDPAKPGASTGSNGNAVTSPKTTEQNTNGGVSSAQTPDGVVTTTGVPDTNGNADGTNGKVNGVDGNSTGAGSLTDGAGVDAGSSSITSPVTASPTVSSEVPTESVNDQSGESRSVLALTGANVLGLLSLATGFILLAGAVLFARRRS